MPLDEIISIVRVNDVILEIGNVPETDYVKVEAMLNAASRRLETLCNTLFKTRTITRRMIGSSYPNLDLGAPIQSITSVVLNGQALVEGNDYYSEMDQGLLVRLSGWSGSTFTADPRNVEVTAVLGWDPIPYDVQLACKLLVKHWYQGFGRDSTLRSEKFTEYAYERFAPSQEGNPNTGDLPEEVRSLALPYRRWNFG